ncbi:hypothetical protein GCM10027160_23200 [Streptomyces calidiresistens]|uniref:DUF1870 family protein n=1 Tax=Streptomyces calidiresistens TaxID=1485586 RepID=A0A7W3T799_9ACTN|nr:DUF1870 family protein [Streptomyces calidiresistens]MBB0232248.1 DUF1870 family protein [Streptomyces calidiresistens]
MSTSSHVQINEVVEDLELYRHFPGRNTSQPAHILLDLKNGTLSASYDVEVGEGTPPEVFYGHTRRYRIPLITAQAANTAMQEIAPLADRILADSSIEWDGNNNVAVLGEDAQEAEEEIREHLGCDRKNPEGAFDPNSLIAEWDIDGVTADTTDSRLEEIEREILTGISEVDEGTPVCPALLPHLKELRDDLAEEDPLTPAELQTAREDLGLTGDLLAKLLGVNPRTLRSWEAGRDPIPGRIRPEIAQVRATTAAAVDAIVQEHDGEDEPSLLTYRSDEDFRATSPDWPLARYSAQWHRRATLRAAERLPGARITYGGDTE